MSILQLRYTLLSYKSFKTKMIQKNILITMTKNLMCAVIIGRKSRERNLISSAGGRNGDNMKSIVLPMLIE